MKKTALLINSAAFFLLASTVSARITVVGSGPEYGTIQQAIDDCNDGDTVLVPTGTYGSINFNGKAITVTSENPDDPCVVGATIIDAGGAGSAVTFADSEGPNSVLAGLTVTGGYGTVNEVFGDFLFWGAGVYCYQASPTISGNIITNNHGPTGAGDIYGYGGAIGCLDSSPQITQNTIRDNSAFAGAGIMVYGGSAHISGNAISNNSAEIGGGVVLLETDSPVTNCTVNGNSAQEHCGGIYGSAGPILNCTITRNSAFSSAAVYGCEGVIRNCLIADNEADEEGAGLSYCSGSISNCTIADNRAYWGGAVYECYGVVSNCIIWGNQPYQVGDSSAPTYSCVEGGATGVGNISDDPCFADPCAGDYHLTVDSRCINAADPGFVPGPGQTDIDGDIRIFAGRVDIGADEFVGHLRPIADAGPDQYIKQIQLVTLDASGSYFYDPCGLRQFQWSQISGPPVSLSDETAMQATFMPDVEGEYGFELVVSDELYTSYPNEVVIAVGNRPPVADAGLDILCRVGNQVSLDGSESYDPDPFDEVSHAWRQVRGPHIVLDDSNTPTPSFDCSEYGLYEFELIVSDGLEHSEPSRVQVATVDMTVQEQELDVGCTVPGYYFHNYPDISGARVVYGMGYGCPLSWDIKSKDLETGEVIEFGGGGIHAQPKIEGDLIVHFGAKSQDEPIRIEAYDRSSISYYQLPDLEPHTLKAYTATESYSHPAISGTKVVWLEHLNLDPSGVPCYNRPYNICGADVNDIHHPEFFTIDVNVGSRDVTGNAIYEFDDVVDICGDIVVWEGNGDIYGADISDLNDIKVFPICTNPASQFDPAVSGNLVVWTDMRNDEGDLYGAYISNVQNIEPFAIINADGRQEQPAVVGHIITYVDFETSPYYDIGEIKVCHLTREHGGLNIPLSQQRYGVGPSMDGQSIVWQAEDSYSGSAEGISLQVSYAIADGAIENLTTGKRYDYLEYAAAAAGVGDHILIKPGVYHDSVHFKGKGLTVRSVNPDDPAIVAATVINGDRRNPVVSFSDMHFADPPFVFSGFTITGGQRGIYCTNACPLVSKCNIVANYGPGIQWQAWLGCRYPMISNCTFAANRGSGIDFQGRTNPSVVNCLAAGNGGHGIYARSPKLINCTVVDNGLSGLWSLGGTVSNCIIRNNRGSEIQGSPIVRHSDIQGGWAGVGNMDADPCFVQPGHWDSNGVWVDGDYRLAAGSLCVDAGDNGCLPPDTTDLDGDANTAECIPWDLGCNLRMVDGNNDGNCVVDIGAHEFFRPPIEVAMKFTPSSLNPASQGNWIKLHFVLPEGYAVDDVDVNSPAECRLMDTGEMIESEYVKVFVNEEGLVEVEAAFDRSAFSLCLSQPAERTLTVMGMLAGTGGQDFYGTDTIKIINKALEQIAALASYWLTEACGEPDWCGGFDFDQDGAVNFADFAMMDACCVEIMRP
ncbi:MAG: right-handed parallel beta-helix repeat-containing protein [Planctomycetota bacterium]|jgi:beta propeller repeat protein